uniref:Uncharacterized protein n=1 Tax=Cyanistes caeruleus TaxID=156563 RepID=A0A8C0VP89_CYACU
APGNGDKIPSVPPLQGHGAAAPVSTNIPRPSQPPRGIRVTNPPSPGARSDTNPPICIPGSGRIYIPGSGRICIPGSGRICIPGSGRICIPGSGRICIPGSGRICIPGSGRICIPGSGRICIPGSGRICIPGSGRICIPGSAALPDFPRPDFTELPPPHPLRKLRFNFFPLLQKDFKSQLPSPGAAWSFTPRSTPHPKLPDRL